MMLYESPTNANMWLSDPDTHPVVSQVLRIYHAEKHSLSQHRQPPPASSSSAQSTTSNSSSPAESSIIRSIPPHRYTLPPRTNSNSSINSSVFSVRSDQSQTQFSTIPANLFSQSLMNIRTVGNNGLTNNQLPPGYIGWVSTNSTSSSPVLHRTLPSSSPAPPPQVNASPSSSPSPAQLMRLNTEEPMSHSGSPIRGSTGQRGTADVPNGVTPEITMTLVPPTVEGQQPVYRMSVDHFPQTTLPNPANNDVEMDDPAIDSQDMETQ